MGGLFCGAVLSKEGMKVLVLESHHTIGGCLQSFRRNGRTLDTGMHYVGSMREGQIMHLYLKYLGVIDSLRLSYLDETGFDVIHLPDGHSCRHAVGYDRFVETLAEEFPHERDGIRRYSGILQDIGRLISPGMLREGKIADVEGCMKYMSISAAETIDACVKDQALRDVLAGANPLYAGSRKSTSLYVHGIVNNSNIEGCCGFINGSQQLADRLSDLIRCNGGEIRCSARVTNIRLKGAAIDVLEIEGGERIEVARVISSIHPAATLALLDSNTVLRRSYYNRINSMTNTYGFFTTYLLIRQGALPYANRNHWYYNTRDVWSIEGGYYKGFSLPFMLVTSQPDATERYTEVVTVLTPMDKRILDPWTATRTGRRGAGYEAFKQRYSDAVIDYVCRLQRGLKESIERVCTASPLTYRDITGTPDGCAYGVMKDYHNPLLANIPVRMKISNLFMTGQSINVHGCLGTSVSAIATCGELVGTEYLTKKISHA